MTWRMVPRRGGELATRAFGSGDLAVLVGGGPGLSCHYMWPLAERLGVLGFTAVCFQARGITPSTGDTDMSLGAMAEDIHAVRVAYGAERVHVLAHSFGGFVAWALLAPEVTPEPSQLASLVLVGACSPSPEANRTGDRLLVERVNSHTRPAGARRDATGRFLADVPSYGFDPDAPVPEPLVASRVHEDVRRAVMAVRNPIGAFASYAARYRGPALVVSGERDPLGPAPAAANVSALVNANVTATTVCRVGHFPWLERASPNFDTVLSDWVRSL